MMKYLTALAFTMLAVNAEAQSSNQFMQYPSGGNGGNAGSLTGFTGPGIAVDTDGGPTWTARCLAAGTGVSIAHACGAAGNFTISIDTSVVPLYSQGTSAVSATGAVGTFYFETDANRAFFYTSTDTEHQILSVAPGTLAQGDIFYINSSLVPVRLAPGTSGQFLQTQGAAANPQWATAASATDYGDVIDMVEEWCSGTTAVPGNHNLLFTATLAGTNASIATPIANHPCLGSISSASATDNSGGLYRWVMSDATDPWGPIWDDKSWTMEAIIRMGHAGAITDTKILVGVADASLANQINFERDTDLSHTAFIARICDSATNGCQAAGDDTNSDTVTTDVTPSAGDWVKFKIEHDLMGVGGNPTYYFSINGVQKATFCSSGCDEDLGNLSTANMVPMIQFLQRATGTTRTVALDMWRVRVEGLGR